MELGSTPAEESCAQVGSERYYPVAKKECRAYINQLRRQHGEPPEGADLRISAHSHDFGTYHEVSVVYDTDDRESVKWAFKVEADLPGEWDDAAREELTRAGVCTAMGCKHDTVGCVEMPLHAAMMHPDSVKLLGKERKGR